ncbi:MAG: lysylphosphatidylglycerol synthase transmembrane domain-containing protein [Eubacteriales bacterium]|nr:lysylphosphatidylglycerol synthase transmembrane domain-containing protein [Eubacteriales bacterium]
MADKRKALLNFVFLITVFSLTMYFVFRGEDINEILAVVRQADGRYLLLGIVCVVLFIIGESVIIFYMMRSLGAKVRMGHCALYSFVGFFFSCITPSATGGQPMQIYYMKKDKLPIPVSTLVLMIVTITYKAVLVFIGVLICIFGRGFLNEHLGEYMWVFYLGLALNIFCVALMLVLVFAPGLAKWIMVKGLKIIEHFHIVKAKKSRLEKLERSMDQYHETAAFWASHKRIILNVFVITLVQRIILFTVTYWVYRAMGFHTYGIFTVTVLQSVISIAVDMLPLPGGMGISESLYMVMFVPVFGSVLLPSMLLSRGIAYYGQMLISAVMTCVAHLVIGRKVPKEKEGKVSC